MAQTQHRILSNGQAEEKKNNERMRSFRRFRYEVYYDYRGHKSDWQFMASRYNSRNNFRNEDGNRFSRQAMCTAATMMHWFAAATTATTTTAAVTAVADIAFSSASSSSSSHAGRQRSTTAGRIRAYL